MDPTATLVSIRALVKVIYETPNEQHLAEMAIDLAELVEALDGWLSKSGHLPAHWYFARRGP